ncbi:alpha/beta hydrolase [Millisia brevis]|uniref:alpha/beta hydrolase n=1 Tax=Millisia brevis TaxID=264148 RepID=UPI00082DEB24|nr:alpha/beta fold hydrolase [Millisia brevis]
MPYFTTTRGRVFYRHWPTRRPRAALIFAHGFGEHSGLYRRFAEEIGAQGVDLWALDLRGHGFSDGGRGAFGSIEDLADDLGRLAAIARGHAPGLPLALGGHSLGSLVALWAALDASDDYAALAISGAPLSPLDWLTDIDAGGGLDLDPADLSSDPAYLEQLAGDPQVFTSADNADDLAAAFAPAWQRLEAGADRLEVPVLAVHGARDRIAPLDGVTPWAQRLPDLRIEVVDGAGHDVLNEVDHRRVADRVGRFVAVRGDLLARAP